MEHISVKKKIDRLIITHKIERNEQINSMELDIINKGEIPALLPVQIRRGLTGKSFRFVVQNYTDLRSQLKGNIKFDLFAQIILQIISTLQACEAHGIRCSNLELTSDLSFFDFSKQQVRMIYWPLISLDSYSNIPAFFMELGSIYTAKDSASEYRLRFLQFFDSRAKFDLDAFKAHVEALLKKWQYAQRDPSRDKPVPKPVSDIPPTVGLRSASLQRLSNNTTIEINHYPFYIGRKQEFSDYAIPENTFVGGRHAVILLRSNKIYIRDNNSRNGTYVNGIRLQPGTDEELNPNDRIRIANEEFVFVAAGC